MIKRYCHISIKNSLYRFQKRLNLSKILTALIFVFIFSGTVKSQIIDTISLKIKNSKLLIISKGENIDEWSFEDEEKNKAQEKIKNKLNITLGFGWFNLYQQNILKGQKKFETIPYNKNNSNTQNLVVYLKYFEIINNKIQLSVGGGLKIQRLNLGFNRTFLTNDSISFINDPSLNNNRNVLKYRYINFPVGITFLFKNKPLLQFEINNHLLTNGKLDIKTSQESKKLRHETTSTFFQKRYYASIRTKLIFNKIGVFAESGLISSSTIFENQFNFSCGIILCNYR
jgi:hypothetical protein